MSSSPLPVIGSGSVSNGGACIYNGGNSSTMSINCAESIQFSNMIIHAESDISKYLR